MFFFEWLVHLLPSLLDNGGSIKYTLSMAFHSPFQLQAGTAVAPCVCTV